MKLSWQQVAEWLVLFFKGVPAAVDFCADLVTVLLAAIALYGLVTKRKELRLLLSALLSNHLSNSTNRVKETLGTLDSRNFDVKEHRKEIRALIGQLRGQVGSLCRHFPEFNALHQELGELMDGKRSLTEAKKRHVSQMIHMTLESLSVTAQINLVEKSYEREDNKGS